MKGTIVQIDQSGRIVIPKPLRDRFRLKAGDRLAIKVRGEAIELRPTRAVGQLKRINGVLVFTGPAPLGPGQELVDQSREERIDDLTRGQKPKP